MRNFELGFRGTDLRRRLVAAVLSGQKTATASLRAEYEPATEEPLPYVGERCRLLGSADEPLGIVETVGVNVVPAGEVDLDFAVAEGEGFECVEDWRAAHERFWAGIDITDATEIVCERFRLIEVF